MPKTPRSINPGVSVAQAANFKKTEIEQEVIQAASYRLCTMQIELWSNSTENFNLVGQIAKKLLVKVVIFKMLKPGEFMGESVSLHIHPQFQPFTTN